MIFFFKKLEVCEVSGLVDIAFSEALESTMALKEFLD